MTSSINPKNESDGELELEETPLVSENEIHSTLPSSISDSENYDMINLESYTYIIKDLFIYHSNIGYYHFPGTPRILHLLHDISMCLNSSYISCNVQEDLENDMNIQTMRNVNMDFV